MKRVVLLLLLSMFQMPTMAGFTPGNTLYNEMQVCETSEYKERKLLTEAYACGFVNGYIRGAWDAVYESNKENGICIPTGVTVGQMTDVVHLWMKNNPGKRAYTADSLFRAAILETWPCTN